MQTLTLEQARAQRWDVIVIGTGMGGGLLGRRLAELGQRVLFVEKGPAGHAAERQHLTTTITDPAARLVRGAWPKPAESRLGGVRTRFMGPYGTGVGGSSAYYAGALEIPERHDLDADPARPHPAGGWPVGYDAFRPHFDRAARYLHLNGSPDPLSPEPPPGDLAPPGPLPPGDAALEAQMRATGLHPYRQHMAVRWPQTCRQCFGRKCPWGCKMDGRSAGVVPALETGRAGLVTDCEVLEILDDGTRVTGLRVAQNGQGGGLEAPRYALCAGSLGSPRLLLGSRRRRPEGVANSSGWVGRGLMFHLNEFFLLWPRGGGDQFGRSFSLRDVYSRDGLRFGLVQSLGLEASYGNIVFFMGQIFDQSPLRRFPALRGLVRIPALVASRLFGSASVFVGQMEDFPYPENRVVLNEEDPEILTFEYRFAPELLARRRRFRRELMRRFRGLPRLLVSPQPVLNFGHPVGTLRFGTDPASSVLRPDCRTHDLDNLYVADGSFMPSALGVNPSLTIAANALRVAEIIARTAGRQEETADAP